MRSRNTKNKARVERFVTRLDIELADTGCLSICPCKANGSKLTELSQFSPKAKETAAERRDRKVKLLEAMQQGQVLPIDMGIDSGTIRFVFNAINDQEKESWVGQASGFLDASFGYLSVQDTIIQLPANRYQVTVFGYVPNRSSVSHLASAVSGWDGSISLLENLQQYWKSTRRYKCDWTKKSIQCAVAVIVQLTPTSIAHEQIGSFKVNQYSDKQFALQWTFRNPAQCPDLIEPFFDEQDDDEGWEIESIEVPKPRKKAAASSRKGSESHPRYPILFSVDELMLFREQLIGLVLAAKEKIRFEPHKVVPRATASVLKEFDHLSEDSRLYPRFMLAIACTQIECGHIQAQVADEALDCLSTMERIYQLDLKGAERKKALRELDQLRKDIEESSWP